LGFLSLSRGVWLGLLALGTYWLYLQGAKRLILFGIIIVAALLAIQAGIYPELWETALGRFTLESSSNTERVGLALVAWDAFVHHPAAGIGAENFARYLLRNGVPSFVSSIHPEILSPHNFFLQILAENGLVGALSLMVWLGTSYRMLFRSHASSSSWLLGLKMAFIIMLLIFFFGYMAGEMRLTFGLYLGLVLALQRVLGDGDLFSQHEIQANGIGHNCAEARKKAD
jgi:O-antigen ligase